MLATIPSATLLGVEGRAVTVEVQVANGLPCFTVVGLPDASCREARDRVRAALVSSQLPWQNRRVTVNLAPSIGRAGRARHPGTLRRWDSTHSAPRRTAAPTTSSWSPRSR